MALNPPAAPPPSGSTARADAERANGGRGVSRLDAQVLRSTSLNGRRVIARKATRPHAREPTLHTLAKGQLQASPSVGDYGSTGIAPE